jgi:2,3-bisphosphoglycerate-dependent phosphoglycerate mutase
MPSIYLLRHCEYDNPRNILPGRLPVTLSQEGLDRADRLAAYFQDKNISRIYSSAVVRCQQTSEIVSRDTIPVIFDQRLLETFSAYQGYWEENRYGDRYHFYSHLNELGGESFEDTQRRMVSFWNETTPNLQDNIIICSHGDPIYTLYSYLQNMPLVDEHTDEPEVPGWMHKGHFREIVWDGNQIVEILDSRSV